MARGVRDVVAEVMGHLGDGKPPAHCIKILYEVGGRSLKLVAPFALSRKNDRMVPGAKAALGSIAELPGEPLYANLDKPSLALALGSVPLVTGRHRF
ncbi:MAG: hypothetical protein ABIP75_19140 [Pyrinomonadaceae bacterium]